MPAQPNWALGSVILTIIGLLLLVVALILLVRRRGVYTAGKVAAMVFAVATVPVLLLMNSFSGIMKAVNLSTLIIGILVIISFAFILICGRRQQNDEDGQAGYYGG